MDTPFGALASYAATQAIVRATRNESLKNSHYSDGNTYLYFVSDAAVCATLLGDIPQGPSEEERVGKRVRLVSLSLRGVIAWGTAAPNYPLAVVLLVVYDRAPTGSLPAVSDILEYGAPLQQNNAVNSRRFRIVMRRMYGVSFTMQIPIPLDEFIDLKGLHTQYASATNGSLGNIREGALYLYTLGSEPNVAPYSSAANLDVTWRLRFTNEI